MVSCSYLNYFVFDLDDANVCNFLQIIVFCDIKTLVICVCVFYFCFDF